MTPTLRRILVFILENNYYTGDKKNHTLSPLIKSRRNHDMAMLYLCSLNENISLTDLRELILCSSRTFDAVVIKLQDLGFITLSKDNNDKRIKRVSVTRKTWRHLKLLDSSFKKIYQKKS